MESVVMLAVLGARLDQPCSFQLEHLAKEGREQRSWKQECAASYPTACFIALANVVAVRIEYAGLLKVRISCSYIYTRREKPQCISFKWSWIEQKAKLNCEVRAGRSDASNVALQRFRST